MGKKCAQAVGSAWTKLCKTAFFTQCQLHIHRHVHKKVVLQRWFHIVFPSKNNLYSICKNAVFSTLSTTPTTTTILYKNNPIIMVVAQ